MKQQQEAEQKTVKEKEEAALRERHATTRRHKKKLRAVVRAEQGVKQTGSSAIAAQQVNRRDRQDKRQTRQHETKRKENCRVHFL